MFACTYYSRFCLGGSIHSLKPCLKLPLELHSWHLDFIEKALEPARFHYQPNSLAMKPHFQTDLNCSSASALHSLVALKKISRGVQGIIEHKLAKASLADCIRNTDVPVEAILTSENGQGIGVSHVGPSILGNIS